MADRISHLEPVCLIFWLFVTIQYLHMFPYGQRSKCADLLNSYGYSLIICNYSVPS